MELYKLTILVIGALAIIQVIAKRCLGVGRPMKALRFIQRAFAAYSPSPEYE